MDYDLWINGEWRDSQGGKPYEFGALGADLPFAVDNLRFFAAAARDVHGSHAGEYMSGFTSIFRREPVGVVNVVTGGNDTGQALVEHPDVRMVSLTGSTGTGNKVMKTAADTLKRVHLELGGKAPLIVFDDADVESFAGKATLASTLAVGDYQITKHVMIANA